MTVVPLKVRYTADSCVRCRKPILPGQLYAVLADGPRHFGCESSPASLTSSPRGGAVRVVPDPDARPGLLPGAGSFLPDEAA